MLESFLDILAGASGGAGEQAGFRTALAGSNFRVRAEPQLLDALTASLHRREPLPGDGLDIVAWANSPSPINRAPAEWRVAERWAQRQPVRAANDAGIVYFDPIGGIVTIYDAAKRLGGLWVEKKMLRR
jgi:hypothetical protein